MSKEKEIVIVDAVRTAIGNFSGSLAPLTAAQLGAEVIKSLIARNKLNGADVSEVIMGQILTAATGQNPARQAAIHGGVAQEATAYTINQVCGSGLRAVAEGMKSILNGDATIVIAGGQESMSGSAHAMQLRNGVKMGDGKMLDTMIVDGLWDAFNNYHMGITAENIAQQFQITRDDQDKFAAASQQKAAKAQAEGKFKAEIIPITIKGKKGDTVVEADEFIRADTTAESLAKLRPAFKPDGSVTAGNASGLNDGAAAVVLMTRAEADKRGLKPLAVIKSWATAGVDPSIMGTGPIPASKKALEKAGWTIKDLDLIEANEAFAAQAISVNRGMGWDESKVNVNGGAIALGHPIGASGARVLTTLLHEMNRGSAKKGLATLCIGGGMGIAMCVEKAA
ncbi:MAG: acetyl-CoA C-acetyltransferase [Alphaproteobacteria bacterium]|nr:acetyl-CoA C-acetyltransferase [Alphaproteobacteria bacterium]